MGTLTDKKPIYDDRVNEILRGMVEGKSREELAAVFGYKSYKTLDIYMRRKNFAWDRAKQAYVPAHSRIEQRDLAVARAISPKVVTVLSLFEKEGADAKTIAKRLGFADHRELANYMKAKGYKWSSEIRNYVKVYGQLEDTVHETEQDISEEQHNETVPAFPAPTTSGVSRTELEKLERYMPLLEILERNRERLVDMIVPGAEHGKVPRYVVPGVYVTKSVHMTNTLDQLVRDYSKEKNISQRDIFIVALIEFFRRYGYEREMETLLGRV